MIQAQRYKIAVSKCKVPFITGGELKQNGYYKLYSGSFFPVNFKMLEHSSEDLNGFVIYPFIPEIKHFWFSPSIANAVSAIIGILALGGCIFKRMY